MRLDIPVNFLVTDEYINDIRIRETICKGILRLDNMPDEKKPAERFQDPCGTETIEMNGSYTT